MVTKHIKTKKKKKSLASLVIKKNANENRNEHFPSNSMATYEV